MAKTRANRIGILTAGGDCPGLNAAIRGVGKAAMGTYGIKVVGIYDGFLGLIEHNFRQFEWEDLSGILSRGGTILRTSRVKPHKFETEDGETVDMTDVAAEHYHEMGLDCLVCLGGGGTQKNALQLMEKTGINVITLPKTIDNDIAGTDVCFGFDTATSIATEAIDRLHSTADSHRRIMVVEIMGNRVGWLALAAGVAGGADAILIPEIPYDIEAVAEAVRARDRRGSRFSIVAVAEGARPQGEELTGDQLGKAPPDVLGIQHHVGTTVARQLRELTGIESRVTVLGHVQRGGPPTPNDRLLATKLGTAAAELLAKGKWGTMVASRGQGWKALPLEDVAGERRYVELDHPLVSSARRIGACLGDE